MNDDAVHRARDQARMRRIEAAQRFKPELVNVLLVAEAPPEAMDRYFYFTDVNEHDSLFRYICRTILQREPSRWDKEQALNELQDLGVFLIDLFDGPLGYAPIEQIQSDIVARCRALNPGAIILIKADVFDIAFKSLRDAGLPVVKQRIPFPGSGHQIRFVELFGSALETVNLRRPGTT